jgi:hypothetical protein
VRRAVCVGCRVDTLLRPTADGGWRCPDCGHCATGRKVWTREAVVHAMRSWAATHGAAPKADQWRYAGVDHPHVSQAIREFGSWNAAIRASGLSTHLEFRRNACTACGCLYAERTRGCGRCSRRHWQKAKRAALA